MTSPLPQQSSDLRSVMAAVVMHANTLDAAALGLVVEHRDDTDNRLYNFVRSLNPEWWDARVPGLARTPEPDPTTEEEIR